MGSLESVQFEHQKAGLVITHKKNKKQRTIKKKNKVKSLLWKEAVDKLLMKLEPNVGCHIQPILDG